MRRLSALAALALVALPLNAAVRISPSPRAASSARAYVLREGGFSVKPPAGWTASRDAREDARQKVYGVRFSGPRGADGVLSAISLSYYPPDNALFKGGMAEFLKRNLSQDERFVAPAGESVGPVKKTVLGGLPAQSFTRRSREFIPPDRTDSKPVAVVEEIEVAQAKKGFYVLEFRSSAESAPGLEPVFARFRAGVRLETAD